MSQPREPLTAEALVRLAALPPDQPRMIAFGELVASGLARIEDIGELRDAGLELWEIEGSPVMVWVEPRDFVAAAAVVAQLRNEAASGCVH